MFSKRSEPTPPIRHRNTGLVNAAASFGRRELLLGSTMMLGAACRARPSSARSVLRPRMGSGALSSASAESSRTAPGFSTKDRYTLVKDWDFTSLIRDTAALSAEFHTRYIYGDGTTDHLNDEWTRYRDSNNHVFTPEGLSLVARVVQGFRPGGLESGMLRSRWSGKYGAFEASLRVPAARGAWPAFWLNPQDQRWPPEIDVVEIVNNGRDTTRRSFHMLHGKSTDTSEPAFSQLNRHGAYEPGLDYSQAFHLFAVEWLPERVRHYVDGTLISDRSYLWLHDDGGDAGNAHVLVNLAVGGGWPGPPSGSDAFPVNLDIRYIRVWQRS